MRGSVLIIDDDLTMASLMTEALTDEGFAVSLLANKDPVAIRETVARLEPNVVLLDGASSAEYGRSWSDAAWLHERGRPIPVVMCTGHERDRAEAELGETDRSRRAAFVGILSKPFDLSVLVEVIDRAVQQSEAVLAPATALE